MYGHGATSLRGLTGAQRSSTSRGKFGRMFRWLDPGFQPETVIEESEIEGVLLQLARLMLSTEFNDRIDVDGKATPDSDIMTPDPKDENRTIPAGYTYFGQFIDHDITFDPASSLQQDNDPDALEDFRTPRLDLDSIYGAGPDDQPYLYDPNGRVQFVMGPPFGKPGPVRSDLLRVAPGSNNTAILGDKRNDENKIVSQIHVLFLRFHNRVFQELARRDGAANQATLFSEAQRIVRWCYQWIVLHDYLPRVCGQNVIDEIMPARGTREPRFAFYQPESGEAFMPVEFSVAAFRFGHSMVRPSYKLNDQATSSASFVSAKGKKANFARIPILVFPSANARGALNGFGEPLPDDWGIDWSFFFGQIPAAHAGTKQVPQPSYRIDTTLVDPLGVLPEFASDLGTDSPFVQLPYRNLLRGFRMGLPSGQSVARAMGFEPMRDEELWHLRGGREVNDRWEQGAAFYRAQRRWIGGRAPLWFYLLKEAERQESGQRLGEVGSRIVAETLIGLIWYDHFSYLFQSQRWHPGMEGIAGLDRGLDMLALSRYVDSAAR